MLRRVLRGSLVVGLSCGCVACGDDTPVAPRPIALLVSTVLSVQDAVARPQSDAIVEVRTGPDAGATTTTNAEGYATVSAHAPTSGLTFRISKPGFTTAETTVWVQNGHTSLGRHVILESVTSLNLAGEYLLTIEASPACSQLPQGAKRRVYEATAVSNFTPSYFEIRLRGALFVTDRNNLAVTATADTARFWLSVPSLDGEDIVEQLSPSSYLMLYGDATVEASQEDRVLSAPLNGRISYCPAGLNPNFTCSVPPVDCNSESHRLILSRR